MCLVGCLAFFMPRLVMASLWGFYDYFVRFETWYWPLLGFFFMPYTTLTYAYVLNSYGGKFEGGLLVLLIVSVILDLGLTGKATTEAKGKETATSS